MKSSFTLGTGDWQVDGPLMFAVDCRSISVLTFHLFNDERLASADWRNVNGSAWSAMWRLFLEGEKVDQSFPVGFLSCLAWWIHRIEFQWVKGMVTEMIDLLTWYPSKSVNIPMPCSQRWSLILKISILTCSTCTGLAKVACTVRYILYNGFIL